MILLGLQGHCQVLLSEDDQHPVETIASLRHSFLMLELAGVGAQKPGRERNQWTSLGSLHLQLEFAVHTHMLRLKVGELSKASMVGVLLLVPRIK